MQCRKFNIVCLCAAVCVHLQRLQNEDERDLQRCCGEPENGRYRGSQSQGERETAAGSNEGEIQTLYLQLMFSLAIDNFTLPFFFFVFLYRKTRR